MDLVKLDIDQLLELTSYSLDEDYQFKLKKVEIDKLLEKTQDW
ncbi:hypothetical protein [Neobacillus sp. D3-1R]